MQFGYIFLIHRSKTIGFLSKAKKEKGFYFFYNKVSQKYTLRHGKILTQEKGFIMSQKYVSKRGGKKYDDIRLCEGFGRRSVT